MVKFIDGPAAGLVLDLRNAPALLRVVQFAGSNEWDALDQPDDNPRPQESIIVYVIASMPTPIHVRCSNRHASGFRWMADYRLFPWQPDDATMRSTVRWYEWVEAQLEAAMSFSKEHPK